MSKNLEDANKRIQDIKKKAIQELKRLGSKQDAVIENFIVELEKKKIKQTKEEI